MKNYTLIDLSYLLAKMKKDEILSFARNLLQKCIQHSTLSRDETRYVKNDEALRIFIELIIIANLEKYAFVVNKNQLDANDLKSLKKLWGELFPKLEVRYSGTSFLTHGEE